MASSAYFEAGGMRWKLPRPTWCGRLLQLMAGGSVGIEANGVDTLKVTAAENALGAALGICWANPGIDLGVPRPVSLDGADGLLRYGDAVLDALHDAGDYMSDPEWLREVSGALWERIVASVIPSEPEVAEQLGNGLSPEATRT